MHWVYLSPHLDDVALSCGGLLWDQAQAGQPVQVWTVCAGDPPAGPLSPFADFLHQRWGTTGPQTTGLRRAEDRESCQILGASLRHFTLPDCIYRHGSGGAFLVNSEEDLFKRLDPAEAPLVRRLARELTKDLAALQAEVQVICPLTLGGHVDHRLTRRAAGRLKLPLWYYADYPYVLQESSFENRLESDGYRPQVFPVSEDGLAAWQHAVRAYASQITTFWPDLESMNAALRAYRDANGGVRLWQAK